MLLSVNTNQSSIVTGLNTAHRRKDGFRLHRIAEDATTNCIGSQVN